MNVSTFDVSDVTVLYRAPGTDRTVAATRIPVSAIVALDPVTTQSGFPDDATRFFVRFATPQSAAGTYSYAVGPNVSDRIRTPHRHLHPAGHADRTPRPADGGIDDLGS